MGFADSRDIVRVNVGAAVADNTDLIRVHIPANKEIQVFNLKAYAVVKSPTADALLELVNAANTVLATVTLTHDNGTWASTATTTPVVIRGGATGETLKLRTDKVTGTGANLDIELHMQYPGSE